jgi:chromosome segregation ATPase
MVKYNYTDSPENLRWGETAMPDKELANTLRSILKEELQPVQQEIKQLVRDEIQSVRQDFKEDMQSMRQEFKQFVTEEFQPLQQEMRKEFVQVNKRLGLLEKGQKDLQKDVKSVKTELREVWKDIQNLGTRLTAQENRNAL